MDEDLKERFDLAKERIRQIVNENRVQEPFRSFFASEAAFILYTLQVREELLGKDQNAAGPEYLRERNRKLYGELLPENYETCYGNPDHLEKSFGRELGRSFGVLYAELRGMIPWAFENRVWDMTVAMELFLEAYFLFVTEMIPKAEEFKAVLSAYYYDYCEEFVGGRLREQFDPSSAFALDIIMEADLSDPSYLYAFGEYISENELKTAEYLNTLEESEIEAMASTFTEAYKRGFLLQKKPLDKKKTVNIRYSLGFEKMIRAAVLQFRQMGLSSIIYRQASHVIGKGAYRIGYIGTDVNPQYTFDHSKDIGICLDEKLVTRFLTCQRETFEEIKEQAAVHGGPACLETFGEPQFVPVMKEGRVLLSEEQERLKVRMNSESIRLTNRYIKGEERSFTIIAYPVPQIGAEYERIFAETLRINTLDNDAYQKIQQKIIDVLDLAETVRITGKGTNRTDLTIALHPLADPAHQTNFENCTADVNIPVGEVFTSPKLAGTNGILHVGRVSLQGLNFYDLEIRVKDGWVVDYSCGGFSEQEGKKYVRSNILFDHDTLPIGEFAIGTNTTAYRMGKDFGIEDKLPILIAEKTGPHFAFGDTCYSFQEDTRVYNPDGKEIIARENEASALRKTEPEKAYFSCHTDVTIPFEELDRITAVTKEGKQIPIIENGLFVTEGTQELNVPLVYKK